MKVDENREPENKFDTGEPGPPRPMVGFFALLTPEQQKRALENTYEPPGLLIGRWEDLDLGTSPPPVPRSIG
jgi:hypothetical protein